MEAIAAGFGLFILAMLAVVVGGFALRVWAFVDVVRVEHEWMFRTGGKALWAIVVGLGGPMGAVLYLAVGRPKAVRAF